MSAQRRSGGRKSRRLGRAGGRVLVGLALAVLAAPVAGAGGPIFTFTDQNGVTHFTNVPRDQRYRVLKRTAQVRKIRFEAPAKGQYDGLIVVTAHQLDVQPALIKAVIAAESNFDPGAVSHKGAQGLMQLMPMTAAAMGVADPFHPVDNVRGGTRYLREMIDRYGDLERALAAYNAGPHAVDRYGGIPPYRETKDYVRRVLAYYRSYDGDFRP